MKYLFTADWHIKLGQKHVPREWQSARFRKLFEKLWALEQDVDAHIIGGDIFDRTPTLEELDLFVEYLRGSDAKLWIFPGNHEAEKKHTTFFSELQRLTESLANATVILEPTELEPKTWALPYNWLKRKDWSIPEDAEILYTHVRGEIPPHVKPEIPLEKFERFKIVYAGDLHCHTNTQKIGNTPIVYPGSPVNTTFSRSGASKNGALIIAGTEWEWVDLKLPKLLKKTVTSPEEMLETEYDLTVYDLEGSLEDVGKAKKHKLLANKVVHRESSTTLSLGKDSNIQEELRQYFTKVLLLEEPSVDSILQVFAEYEANERGME